jgi:hypothetical protein
VVQLPTDGRVHFKVLTSGLLVQRHYDDDAEEMVRRPEDRGLLWTTDERIVFEFPENRLGIRAKNRRIFTGHIHYPWLLKLAYQCTPPQLKFVTAATKMKSSSQRSYEMLVGLRSAPVESAKLDAPFIARSIVELCSQWWLSRKQDLSEERRQKLEGLADIDYRDLAPGQSQLITIPVSHSPAYEDPDLPS